MSLRLGKDLSLETKNRDPSGKAGGDADVIHRVCCPSCLVFIHITCYYHTYTTYFGKKIVTLPRVIGIITRKFYIEKSGFEVLGDNIKVFYKQG